MEAEARAAEAEARILASSSKKDALDSAVLATELYMKAVKLAPSSSERDRLKKKCMSVLAKAEEIKMMQKWPSETSLRAIGIDDHELKGPQSTRILSRVEEDILLKGSELNGSQFPPWRSNPREDLFETNGSKDIYTDFSETHLSVFQKSSFAGWKRPSEAFLRSHDSQDTEYLIEPTMSANEKIDLVQDVTTDCSVVASLCAAVARPGNTYGAFLKSIFYPYDVDGRAPSISPSGKYILRLHFNGCAREVVIDDRIPTSHTTRTLHVVDRSNPGLLWPALVEKAYLKVRGGYDFPGSNSGTDLWVLTDWIPEQVFLQSDELQSKELWQKAYRSFRYGDVIITLGTGKLTRNEEEELGLAGEHDYAVLDLKQVGQQQLFLVKNPWCDGAVWKKPPSLVDVETKGDSWATAVRQTLPESQMTSSGTFWISFDEVIRNFDSLYFNWNPGLFKHRQDHHFSWNIKDQTTSNCFVDNPQFSIESRTGGPVWIVLSRHFSTEERQLQTQPKESKSASSPLGYISLYAFDINGRRTYLSDNAIFRGPYVDSPQTLAKLEMPASARYTIVAAQQELPLPKYSFTLSVYSRSEMNVRLASNPYTYCKSISGSWTARTAGGNASSATYSCNPQFKIVVPSDADINLMIEADPPDLAVHVKLAWTRGDRVTAVAARDILGESGEYRRGCAVAKISDVPAGSYTIVCSTFEPGQTGRFVLRVEATVPCEVRSLASEAAGLLTSRLPIVTFSYGNSRVLSPLSISRITRLTVIARHTNLHLTGSRSISRSPLRLTLERGQGPHKTIIAASEEGSFSDSAVGIRLRNVDLGPESGVPGGLWLVLERFGETEGLEEVMVEILSERSITYGPWGTGEG